MLGRAGFGVYHSGLEVNGREYAYGFNAHGGSGVFWLEPRAAGRVFEHRYREGIDLGPLEMDANAFAAALRALEQEWRGVDYSLLGKNCNHFAGALCRAVGKVRSERPAPAAAAAAAS